MSTTTFFFIFIPILVCILLAVNLLFAPHNPYQEKNSAFECGFHSFLGQNRTQFSISFFIFALLFLLFDLEILLIYPYAVSAYTNGIYGLTIMLIFFLALTLGFAFEINKNALKIDSRQMFKIRKITNTISEFFSSPPKPHVFVSLPIQSGLISSITRHMTFAKILSSFLAIFVAYLCRQFFLDSYSVTLTLLDGQVVYIFNNIRDIFIGIIALFTRLSFLGLFESIQANLTNKLKVINLFKFRVRYTNEVPKNPQSLNNKLIKFGNIFNDIKSMNKQFLSNDLHRVGIPANTLNTVGVPTFNSMDNPANTGGYVATGEITIGSGASGESTTGTKASGESTTGTKASGSITGPRPRPAPSGYGVIDPPSRTTASGNPIGKTIRGTPKRYGVDVPAPSGAPIEAPLGYAANGAPIRYGASGAPIGYTTTGAPVGYGAKGVPYGYAPSSDVPSSFGISGAPIGYGASGAPIGYGASGGTTSGAGANKDYGTPNGYGGASSDLGAPYVRPASLWWWKDGVPGTAYGTYDRNPFTSLVERDQIKARVKIEKEIMHQMRVQSLMIEPNPYANRAYSANLYNELTSLVWFKAASEERKFLALIQYAKENDVDLSPIDPKRK